MKKLQKNIQNQIDYSKSDSLLAILCIICKKSCDKRKTISATSLDEIKNELKRCYNKEFTERHILSELRLLGKLIIKEKDPRNHRRSLYKVNPIFVEEEYLTLVALNKNICKKGKNQDNNFEGVLQTPLLADQKLKFLAFNKQ